MTSHTIGAALVVAGVAWLIPAGIYAFCSLLRMAVNRRAEPEKPRNSLACIFKLFDLYSLMKVRDVIRTVEEDGWRFHSQAGSHRQFVHSVKPGRVTIAGAPGDDMPVGTLASILRQAQIKKPRK